MINVFFHGNLGADAEVKNIGGKDRLCMRIAVSEKKSDGTKDTQWVDCLYNVTSIAQYLTKGTKVVVLGKMKAYAYVGNGGQPQCSIQVYANSLDMVGSKPEQKADSYASAIPVATVPPPAPADQPDLPF